MMLTLSGDAGVACTSRLVITVVVSQARHALVALRVAELFIGALEVLLAALGVICRFEVAS